MSTFDSTGLTMDRLPEIIEIMSNDFKESFGADWKVDPESVSGQFIQNIAGVISEQNEIIEGVANIFNPNGAEGFFLSLLVKLNGIERKESKFSTVPLEVTAGTAPTVIPAGSIVTDVNEENDWLLDSSIALNPFETKPVSATAEKPGAILADPGDLTKIKTPVYSWETVTNTAVATPGESEEKDIPLRARRTIASKKTGQCSEPDIFKALSNIDAVESVNLFVNNTQATVSGVPPQFIWAIVRGGTDAEIAAALLESTGGGIGFIGSTVVNHYDEETDRTYEIKFDRQTDVPTYIIVNVSKGTNYPVGGDDTMKQNIVDFYAGEFKHEPDDEDEAPEPGFAIGKPVVYSRLYTPVNSVQGHSVQSMFLGLAPAPVGTADLPMATEEQGFIELANIEVNGV